MFDANFYRVALPERVTEECYGQPGSLPVVNLHLSNGRVLDVCHIIHLADTWFAVQYFRDTETCADMDSAFLPYELVMLVTVSVQHPSNRRIGFSLEPSSELPVGKGSHPQSHRGAPAGTGVQQRQGRGKTK